MHYSKTYMINYLDLILIGQEHAVLHLLYARFWHKVLFDLGVVNHREPFLKLVHQGMILGIFHEVLMDNLTLFSKNGNIICKIQQFSNNIIDI